MTPALRTTTTLAILGLVLTLGVAWGWSQVSKPFPGKVEPPPCVDTTYSAGDSVFPQDVTVSVLNASAREGLAGRTMQLFVDQGFDQGRTGNAPEGTKVGKAEVWTTEGSTPGVVLVRSRLGKVPVRKGQVFDQPGVVVVVGDTFEKLKNGRKSVTAKTDAVVCGPPVD